VQPPPEQRGVDQLDEQQHRHERAALIVTREHRNERTAHEHHLQRVHQPRAGRLCVGHPGEHAGLHGEHQQRLGVQAEAPERDEVVQGEAAEVERRHGAAQPDPASPHRRGRLGRGHVPVQQEAHDDHRHREGPEHHRGAGVGRVPAQEDPEDDGGDRGGHAADDGAPGRGDLSLSGERLAASGVEVRVAPERVHAGFVVEFLNLRKRCVAGIGSGEARP